MPSSTLGTSSSWPVMEFMFCWSRWTSTFPVKRVVVFINTGCCRNPGEIPNPVLGDWDDFLEEVKCTPRLQRQQELATSGVITGASGDGHYLLRRIRELQHERSIAPEQSCGKKDKSGCWSVRRYAFQRPLSQSHGALRKKFKREVTWSDFNFGTFVLVGFKHK